MSGVQQSARGLTRKHHHDPTGSWGKKYKVWNILQQRGRKTILNKVLTTPLARELRTNDIRLQIIWPHKCNVNGMEQTARGQTKMSNPVRT
jgi:hypothetical protein